MTTVTPHLPSHSHLSRAKSSDSSNTEQGNTFKKYFENFKNKGTGVETMVEDVAMGHRNLEEVIPKVAEFALEAEGVTAITKTSTTSMNALLNIQV